MKPYILLILSLLSVAPLAFAQRRAARALPAEAVQAASLERTAFARIRANHTNAFSRIDERSAIATNRASVILGRIAFEDRALIRDGRAPTNAPALIQSARWKILSVQSVTNYPH